MVNIGRLVLVMIGAGVLGGFINYYLNRHDQTCKHTAREYVVIGVGAALLVPLFLNMISSNLLERSETDTKALLVILGFCLVGAISSKAFIQTLSDQILKKAQE